METLWPTKIIMGFGLRPYENRCQIIDHNLYWILSRLLFFLTLIVQWTRRTVPVIIRLKPSLFAKHLDLS